MPSNKPTIGILTGGGDCPGLNAVIRAAVKTALKLGYDCVGFLKGYEGLVDPVAWMPLDLANTANILLQGGTILGSTNKGRFSVLVGEGARVQIDPELLAAAGETVRQLGISGLICIGGDGSLAIAQQLHEHGIPVVGVPKTIDNDLGCTAFTFGFDSAVAAHQPSRTSPSSPASGSQGPGARGETKERMHHHVLRHRTRQAGIVLCRGSRQNIAMGS